MAKNVVTDLHVSGPLTCRSFTPPAGCVGNNAIQAGAGINSSKVKQQTKAFMAFPADAPAANIEQGLDVIYGATATLSAFRAKLSAACEGNAEVTVDLLKNGETVLTEPITLVAASGTDWVEASGFVASALVEDDELDVSVSVNAGTGELGNGLKIQAVISNEDPQ